MPIWNAVPPVCVVFLLCLTGTVIGDDPAPNDSDAAATDAITDTEAGFADDWKRPDGPLENGWRVTHTDHAKWWDPLEIRDGSPVNINPDKGKIVQKNNSGSRCSASRDFGKAFADEFRVSVEWNGDHRAVGFPIACINPEDPDWGIAFCYEPNIAGGVWVLWAMGRRPDQIRIVKAAGGTKHVDGEPAVLEMRVTGNQVTCLADGNERLTSEIPEALTGSTIHGFGIDVNPVPDRPANFEVLSGPFEIRPLAERESR